MAEWTTAYINDLPDSSFAYIEPGGTKDAEGKTTPRSLRHFPYRDADGKIDRAHLANAMARAKQSDFGEKAMPKLMAAEKQVGMGMGAGKAFLELKAQDFTRRQLEAWLGGEISRRILVLPFGGPLPGGPKGRDLDGEFFDERTDIYGPFPWLRSTRERLVDWHHDDLNVPPDVARMKGAVIGRIVLDDEPEEDGYWADWWAKAGERRLALVKLLEKNRVPLYGSTEPVKGSTHVEPDGHIDLWPIIRHTITTSPQNTWAVVPPLKALLTDPDVSFDDVGLVAVKAALVGIDVLTTDLRESSSGDGLPGASVAAGRGHVEDDPALHEFLEGLALTIPKLERILT